VYRPAQNEVIEQLNAIGARKVADIACGTGILADRIRDSCIPTRSTASTCPTACWPRPSALLRRAVAKGPAEHLPFEDGVLDAVVTTSAFHFFDQPAALREFHRYWLLAVWCGCDLSPGSRSPASAVRQPAQPCTQSVARRDAGLFEGAAFRVSDQHRVRGRRPDRHTGRHGVRASSRTHDDCMGVPDGRRGGRDVDR